MQLQLNCDTMPRKISHAPDVATADPLITAVFAERELDVEKLSKLKTSNSRLPCLEPKAYRPFAAVETACKKNLVIILRVENFNRTFFGKPL